MNVPQNFNLFYFEDMNRSPLILLWPMHVSRRPCNLSLFLFFLFFFPHPLFSPIHLLNMSKERPIWIFYFLTSSNIWGTKQLKRVPLAPDFFFFVFFYSLKLLNRSLWIWLFDFLIHLLQRDLTLNHFPLEFESLLTGSLWICWTSEPSSKLALVSV